MDVVSIISVTSRQIVNTNGLPFFKLVDRMVAVVLADAVSLLIFFCLERFLTESNKIFSLRTAWMQLHFQST